MPNMWQLVRVAGLSIAVMLAARSARANEDFYAGKTLTIIAGFPPGGGVDGEMRVLTTHTSPNTFLAVPPLYRRNMPGAGGIVLGNTLYNVAAADGLTVGMPGRSGFLLSNVVPQKGHQVRSQQVLLHRRRRQRRQRAVAASAEPASPRWMSSSAPSKQIVIGALTHGPKMPSRRGCWQPMKAGRCRSSPDIPASTRF